jgi:DNA-binding CsgD family transcriptional regulator
MVEIHSCVEAPVRGRSREIGLLDASVRALTRGRGGVVLIEGPPGSGKTRLTEKALLSARRDGLRGMRSRAVASERGTFLKPLTDALVDGAGPALDPVGLREIERLHDKPRAAIAEVERRLSLAAARSPLVIAIDDVHHADDATLLALRRLPGRLAHRPILWVLTSASGRADSTLCALSLDGANVVHLGPLHRDAVRQIASDVLHGAPSDAVVDLINDLDGHPSSIVELLHALVDEGLVEVTDGTARLTGQGLWRALRGRGATHHRAPEGGAAELGLTRSELAVAELVARGATNRQAAEELFLSPHTVNSHLRHTFEKLGIRSRVQLAVLLTGAAA